MKNVHGVETDKIKAGDRVAIEVVVHDVDPIERSLPIQGLHPTGTVWLNFSDVLAHTPALREIKVGDLVAIKDRHYNNEPFTVKHIDVRSGWAWIASEHYQSLEMISDLCHLSKVAK